MIFYKIVFCFHWKYIMRILVIFQLRRIILETACVIADWSERKLQTHLAVIWCKKEKNSMEWFITKVCIWYVQFLFMHRNTNILFLINQLIDLCFRLKLRKLKRCFLISFWIGFFIKAFYIEIDRAWIWQMANA